MGILPPLCQICPLGGGFVTRIWKNTHPANAVGAVINRLGIYGPPNGGHGDSAPAGGLVQRDAPPIFFLRHQKENAPRPVEKKKCSAGRSAQAQTSCRRRGMVGAPLRQSGTETRCPWGNLQPGEVWDTLILPPRCRSRSREEQPAAAKREAARCDDHPGALRTIRHGTAVPTWQKTQACPKASPNRSRHRYVDPRRARRATAPERA